MVGGDRERVRAYKSRFLIFSLSRTRKMGRWGGQGSLENGIMGCSASENCLNRTKKGSVFGWAWRG
jgi:hypothetical protein